MDLKNSYVNHDKNWTESVCPVCLQKIPAERIKIGDDFYLQKICPTHGEFQVVIWRGNPGMEDWAVRKSPNHPVFPFTTVQQGCPYDCGPCDDHLQQPCCVLLEVTQRCDLNCPLCFASAGECVQPDPSLDTIMTWYQRLLETKVSLNIQLSGGEPCVRDDLPQIIQLGKQVGFSYFQLNTNGLRIARDAKYLYKLIQAGLSAVYLQFDGVHDTVYQTIRGRRLLAVKKKAILNCIKAGIGVVLVPTLIPGVNDMEIGEMVRFALQYHPGVRGIHFQPVSYFGRFPDAPDDQTRITLPEVIRALVLQTDGMIKIEDFKAASAEHARCTFHGNFEVKSNLTLHALTHFQHTDCGCLPVNAEKARVRAQSFVARSWSALQSEIPTRQEPVQGFALWDSFLERRKSQGFTISGMAFQDAWTLDLDRLRECKIFIYAPNGKLVPFCAYNLTNQSGQALYRGCV